MTDQEKTDEPGRHVCEACGASFETEEELDKHVKEEHQK